MTEAIDKLKAGLLAMSLMLSAVMTCWMTIDLHGVAQNYSKDTAYDAGFRTGQAGKEIDCPPTHLSEIDQRYWFSGWQAGMRNR